MLRRDNNIVFLILRMWFSCLLLFLNSFGLKPTLPRLSYQLTYHINFGLFFISASLFYCILASSHSHKFMFPLPSTLQIITNLLPACIQLRCKPEFMKCCFSFCLMPPYLFKYHHLESPFLILSAYASLFCVF